MYNKNKKKAISARKVVSYLDRAKQGKYQNPEAESLRHGMVIRLGVMGDPLGAFESDYKTTKAILIWALVNKHPLTISTKATPFLSQYLTLLSSPIVHMQVSFSTFDDKEASSLEPMVSSPTERLQAIEAIVAAGGWVTARIAPMIPWLRSMRDPRLIVRRLADAGVKHVMIEHLKLPHTRVADIASAVGFDIARFYVRGLGYQSGHQRTLYPERRVANVVAWRDAVHDVGMSFGCGDNDMKLANDSLCCCGTDIVLGRNVIHHPMVMRTAEIIREKGSVGFEEFKDDWLPNNIISLNRSALRSLVRDESPGEIQRTVYRHIGINLYGVRKARHRYELDPSARLVGDLMRPAPQGILSELPGG